MHSSLELESYQHNHFQGKFYEIVIFKLIISQILSKWNKKNIFLENANEFIINIIRISSIATE